MRSRFMYLRHFYLMMTHGSCFNESLKKKVIRLFIFVSLNYSLYYFVKPEHLPNM